jgi:hypothetical protein
VPTVNPKQLSIACESVVADAEGRELRFARLLRDRNGAVTAYQLEEITHRRFADD